MGYLLAILLIAIVFLFAFFIAACMLNEREEKREDSKEEVIYAKVATVEPVAGLVGDDIYKKPWYCYVTYGEKGRYIQYFYQDPNAPQVGDCGQFVIRGGRLISFVKMDEETIDAILTKYDD